MSTKREFTVAIYANEYKQICSWVLKNQRLETGGDLFGLWSGDHSAVIQLVVGPGRSCRRATHSFYQDVEYLEKAGSNLTAEEGICHIGEWHSHHTIGLKRPSGGDELTVWTNMPKYGLTRFLLFIGNIESQSHYEGYDAVSVGCFLFESVRGRDMEVLQGRFHLLPNESPFRSKCLSVLEKGAECLNTNEEVTYLKGISTGTIMQNERPVMGYKPLTRRALRHGKQPRLDEKQPENDHEIEDDRTFTVAIYANEYKQICSWVLKNQSQETGGELFGLWSGDNTAVIQLVLGPGKNCKRTTASFYQDVEYLEKAGFNLTTNEGVCHIGEWHSHHTIGLKRPSGGDEQTVWTNMPKYGLSRFLLFIANIEPQDFGRDAVSVGCFLFEESGTNRQKVLQGTFHLLPDESPFRSKCLTVLEEGAECINSNEVVTSLKWISRDSDLERPLMAPIQSTCCILS